MTEETTMAVDPTATYPTWHDVWTETVLALSAIALAWGGWWVVTCFTTQEERQAIWATLASMWVCRGCGS
jgi:hypothetical protein